ncbi:hypothetical protein OG555_19130 [Kribbella sp. NBC_01484]|uniref:hypothetical protein n=1 Tax=Kribbella sp. NBC_01484 TaxID=2903579 RepID=UPI002E3695F4|nr:hypothetical protein [Kribbella sp. NBC_01484]
MTEEDATDCPARVRVWFGRFPIVDYTANLRDATAQASGLRRRFSSLRVTIDPDDSLQAVDAVR